MKVFCLLLSFILGINGTLLAANEEEASYSVGEKVQVQWGGKWIDAEVQSISSKGWVKVSYRMGTKDRELNLPPKNVRKHDGSPPPHEYKPGEQVLVSRKDGTWLEAKVLRILDNGAVEVEFVIDGTTLSPALSPDRLKPIKEEKEDPQVATATTFSSPDFRSWTSTSGTAIEARCAEYVGGKADVTLVKRNGQQLKVRLDQLHVKDRAYLTRSLKGLPVE